MFFTTSSTRWDSGASGTALYRSRTTSASCSICPDCRSEAIVGGRMLPSFRRSMRLSWLRAIMTFPVERPSCWRPLETWLTRSKSFRGRPPRAAGIFCR